jgi:hypothetical protein
MTTASVHLVVDSFQLVIHSLAAIMHNRVRADPSGPGLSDEAKAARAAKIAKYNAAKSMLLQQVSEIIECGWVDWNAISNPLQLAQSQHINVPF